MSRLTKKTKLGDYIFVDGENICPNEIATKLGKLEDLEDELEGIEVLHKQIRFLKDYKNMSDTIISGLKYDKHSLIKENEKLKKAIDILKEKCEIEFFTNEPPYKIRIENAEYDLYLEVTKEQYDLLKEVLE